jgi:hypothetical protein
MPFYQISFTLQRVNKCSLFVCLFASYLYINVLYSLKLVYADLQLTGAQIKKIREEER